LSTEKLIIAIDENLVGEKKVREKLMSIKNPVNNPIKCESGLEGISNLRSSSSSSSSPSMNIQKQA